MIERSIDLQENEDWLATSTIYADCIVADGVIDIVLDLNNKIGVRFVKDTANSTTTTTTKIVSDLKTIPKFEYCELAKSFEPPIVRVTLNYKQNEKNNGEEGTYNNDSYNNYDCYGLDEQALLESVQVEFVKYPQDFWPLDMKDKWRNWLIEKSNEILQEEKLSFPVCEFIEHHGIPTDMMGQLQEGEVSAILFDGDNEQSIMNQMEWSHSKILTEKHLGKNYKLKSNGTSSSSSNNNNNNNNNKHNNKNKRIQLSIMDQYAIKIIRRNWMKWIKYECPICFTQESVAEAVELPCGHLFCSDCLDMYIQSKFSELYMHRQNPFVCPIVACKNDIKVISDGNFLKSSKDKQAIEEWEYNLRHPLSTVLTVCPRKCCKAPDMRQTSTDHRDTNVFCKDCGKMFCEVCLKRDLPSHHDCNDKKVVKLCRRYMKASDEIKIKAEERWHWIKDYAAARQEDVDACAWVRSNAMKCPTCRVPIERSEGCFHMHCVQCGTHFCYECGDEIFYPYYGTHHCWEEQNNDDLANAQGQNGFLFDVEDWGFEMEYFY